MKFENIVIAVFATGLLFWVLLHDPWTPRLTANVGEVSVSNQMAYNSCNLNNVMPEVIATGETDTTEFGAFVLRGHGEVRVYLSSADLVGGKMNSEVTERMNSDIKSGYRLFTHIHNHPFLFGREVGDRMWTTEATIEDIAGALAPSMSDVSVYRGFRDSHGLEQAWITHGLQTSRFHDKEFDILAAR